MFKNTIVISKFSNKKVKKDYKIQLVKINKYTHGSPYSMKNVLRIEQLIKSIYNYSKYIHIYKIQNIL